MKTLIMIVLFACSIQAMGQSYISDPTLKKDFAAQVKSVDEFIARFNGKESKPGLNSKSKRRDNILSLFDFNMSHGGLNDVDFKNLLSSFTKEVIDWKDSLSIASNGTIAEAVCLFKYEGKEKEITLLLQREQTSKGNQRWALTGVKGMESLGLYNDKRITISPVDHETHFMSLQDFFHSNHSLVPSMRSKNIEIDQMSFLFGLSVSKKINLLNVKKLCFYFLDVPNYLFKIEEIGRKGTNSGWLISHLEKANDEKKKEYINKLFNRK